MNTRFIYIGGFLIVVGLISYYDIKGNDQVSGDLPWPPRIVATGATFALLEVFAGFQPELAAVIAIGFALAILVNTKIKGPSDRSNCSCSAQAADMTVLPNAQSSGSGVVAT